MMQPVPRPEPFGTAELGALVFRLGTMAPATGDADRIERVRHLERLRSVIAAAQAAETAAFVASQRVAQAKLGQPPQRQDRGIAAQIAAARSMSHHAAQRYTGWSVVLTRELPETFAALRSGRTTEHRAMTITKETIFLSREHREQVDRQLGPRLVDMSDRAVEVESRRAGYALDPEGFLDRTRRAAGDRYVSIRPAPDTMVRVTGLLPVAQGVACYASLSRHADTLHASGEPRTRGQVMADTFVERLTGQASAGAVPVEVELVVGTDVLFGRPGGPDGADDTGVIDNMDLIDDTEPGNDGSSGPSARPQDGYDEPALVTAPGLTPVPIPAGAARDLLAGASRIWIRRLFRHPSTGELVAMQTRRREFTAPMKDFLRHRDRFCATPHCGAPIRHADHVVRAEHGGSTRLSNGRGLCAACNYAHQAPGWRSRTLPGGSIETTTPTGHTYRAPPPRPFALAVGGPAPATCTTPEAALRIAGLVASGRLRDTG